MLKAIKIVNYQSHKHTIIKFVAGINVLFGLSQAGKTAILRAIRWASTNRPTGFRYHSQFTDDPQTEVEIHTTDTPKIVHYKTDTEDKYKLGKTKWSSVNKDVPDLVVDALNMSDLNIQNQFDSPLLITSKPSEIAKTINKVTGVEKADVWRSTLVTKTNDLKKEKKIIGKDLKELEEQLKPYEKLAKVGKLIKVIQSVEKKQERYQKEKTVIEDYLSATRERTRVERQLAPFKEVVDQIDEIRNHYVEIWREKEAMIAHIELVRDYMKTKKERQQTVETYVGLLKTEGICPTCFGEVDEQTIERIIEEL